MKLLVTCVCVLFSVGAYADLSSEVSAEAQKSLAFMFQNISRPDAAKGSVVASPSRSNPDYYFHWIRDAALVNESIVEVYARNHAPALKQELMDYAAFSRRNQTTPNRSGGLGEPKFNADGSAFNGEWGRPQNDGPALRAITLIHFARLMIRDGQGAYVKQFLYDGKIPSDTVIKADLEYVAHHWPENSVDLWEEVGGHHFYTTMVQRRAMLEGAQFAKAMGDGGAAAFYQQQAQALTQALQGFWDPRARWITETVGGGGRGKSGLDVGVILGILHGYAGDGFLSPGNDMVMATASALIEAFNRIYPINQNKNLGPAIGRYPEDVYNGSSSSGQGNPWFLSTLAYAELCNRMRVEFSHTGVIRVSDLNKPFLDFVLHGSATVQPGTTLNRGTAAFNAVISGLGQTGDAFFARVLTHRGNDGSMSEQFSRNNGFMTSAVHLSWSYASFITASMWRSAR